MLSPCNLTVSWGKTSGNFFIYSCVSNLVSNYFQIAVYSKVSSFNCITMHCLSETKTQLADRDSIDRYAIVLTVSPLTLETDFSLIPKQAS